MNIIEQIWNRIFLEFKFNENIDKEQHYDSFAFEGNHKYGKYYPILDCIKDCMLKQFNKEDFIFFIDNLDVRRKIKKSLFNYATIDYVFRNVQFEERDHYDILSILMFCCTHYLKNNYGNTESFIKNINIILHKFNKEFINEQIVSTELNSQSDNIKELFTLLEDKRYSVTKKEYQEALKSYEEFRFKNSIIECNSAFESLLKCTCDKYTIYIKGDTVNKLIESLQEANYFNDFSYLVGNLNHLSGIFKTGVNNIRNKDAAHGGGLQENDPDQIITKLALDLTTTYIIYFIKCNHREILL